MRRRQSIMEIVRRFPVHSQEELAEELSREHFHVAQPTLSRDIRELGLIKTPAGYVAAPTEEKATPAVVSFSSRPPLSVARSARPTSPRPDPGAAVRMPSRSGLRTSSRMPS